MPLKAFAEAKANEAQRYAKSTAGQAKEETLCTINSREYGFLCIAALNPDVNFSLI